MHIPVLLEELKKQSQKKKNPKLLMQLCNIGPAKTD